ncbi:MAG: four helix bundle protein [Anaerolineae bacterium]|nr:four helix bundle protein [Anaerolineae bacterium]
MNQKQMFQNRTKLLAVQIIEMTNQLPKTMAAEVIGKQIIRSATSVGANYRAACRAKSEADMVNKLKIVEEEADETQFWLEILIDTDLMPESKITNLWQETDEILAMTVASIKTLRKRQPKSSITNQQS